MNNKTVRDVFSYIEKKTVNSFFIYQGTKIDLDRKVSIDPERSTGSDNSS